MRFKLNRYGLIWAISIVAALTQSAAMADYVAFNGSEVAPNIAEIRVAEDVTAPTKTVTEAILRGDEGAAELALKILRKAETEDLQPAIAPPRTKLKADTGQ